MIPMNKGNKNHFQLHRLEILRFLILCTRLYCGTPVELERPVNKLAAGLDWILKK